MQAEMLDSIVSNSLQDDSSVEYVSPEERPIAFPTETVIKGSLITEKQYRMHVATLFGFEARVIVTNPNDIKDPRSTWWCLADAGIAIGSSRSGSLLGLLHRRERDSRIFTNAEIIFDDFGSKDTLLLNNRGQTFVSLSGFLEILSKTELSSDNIDDFQEEIFGRVLPQLAFEGKAEVSEEYKEKIGMPQPQTQNQPVLPTTYLEALEALVASEKAKLALQAERDEAIRTKAMIGSSREATAMNTASQKSKECKRLTAENAELKDAVGRGTNWCTVSVMKSEWKRDFGHEPDWRQLKKFSADLPTDMQPVKDVDEKVILKNGSERLSKVNRYHREAWDRYRQYEENLRATKNLVTVEVTEEVF